MKLKPIPFYVLALLGFISLYETSAHAFNPQFETLEDGSYEEQSLYDQYGESGEPDGIETPPIQDPNADADAEHPLDDILVGTGQWAYSFKFYPNDGSEPVILKQHRAEPKVKLASLMKVFTGWMAFHQPVLSAKNLALMLKRSINELADQAFQKLGGAESLAQFLRRSVGLELTPADAQVINGSGNPTGSGTNKQNAWVSTQAIMGLLAGIRSSEDYDAFKTNLAIPGEDGTLRARYHDLKYPMYAKTGTLFKTPATNLAGFIELKTGTLVFSVVGNELKEIYTRTTVRVNGKPVSKMVYNLDATLSKGRNLIEAMVRRYVGQAESLERARTIASPFVLFPELFR